MKEFLAQTHIKRIIKYAVYMLLALIVQNMLFSNIRIMGVCPMILPAVAVSVGMFEGPTFGVVFSLIMGFFADMAYIENTVLFTALFPALAFGTALVTEFFVNRRFFAFMGTVLLASAVTAMLQMLFTFAGDAWSGELLNTAVLQTMISLPFSAIAYLPPTRWIKE